jgi:hypothetical protein
MFDNEIRVGAWVRAEDFLGDAGRAMRIREVYEHNGRLAFDALVAAREGDAPATLAERTVWRYAHQVTEIVRPARRA